MYRGLIIFKKISKDNLLRFYINKTYLDALYYIKQKIIQSCLPTVISNQVNISIVHSFFSFTLNINSIINKIIRMHLIILGIL